MQSPCRPEGHGSPLLALYLFCVVLLVGVAVNWMLGSDQRERAR